MNKTTKYAILVAATIAAAIAALVFIEDQPWAVAIPLFLLAVELIVHAVSKRIDTTPDENSKPKLTGKPEIMSGTPKTGPNEPPAPADSEKPTDQADGTDEPAVPVAEDVPPESNA